MPVVIPEQLPANQILRDHGVFVMNTGRAQTQDIRPLKVCILNLMPDKITTETQLLGMLSNSIIQVEITLITMKSHVSKNTSQNHLDTFYNYFEDIKDQFFDAIIITGAPIEHIEFEDVDYWQELKEIFEWTKTNVFSSLFICWASQSALYYFYGIEKEYFPKKLFGVYLHTKEAPKNPLFLGIDDEFYVPQSRNTRSNEAKIRQNPSLQVLSSSKEAGINLVTSVDRRQLFISGHPEYSTDTLLREYLRDIDKANVDIPKNYFKNNDPHGEIVTNWKSHGNMFYNNWLNYYVYQETDFGFNWEK